MNNIISVKAIISRNLKDYKFSPKLTKDKQNEIIQLLQKAVPNFKEVDESNLNELTKRDLILNHNAVIFYDENNEIAINMFAGEHLSIISSSNELDSQTFDNIKALSKELNDKINFAYSDQYGYLMSDVSKLGAGIRLECEMSLPAINSLGKIDQLATNIKRLGYTLSSTDNEDVFVVETKCNLGLKEQEIYDDFFKIISNIESIENESLSILKIESIDELTDKVYRAVANLKYAHMINSGELIDSIVKIQVGLNLDLELKEIGSEKLSKLIQLYKQYNSIEESKKTKIDLAQQISKVL
ncbi:MAG: hypothetical protein IKA36_01040 [Clostridia bacterium]|nr:hypothetical protein [Clostridia bacterium]